MLSTCRSLVFESDRDADLQWRRQNFVSIGRPSCRQDIFQVGGGHSSLHFACKVRPLIIRESKADVEPKEVPDQIITRF